MEGWGEGTVVVRAVDMVVGSAAGRAAEGKVEVEKVEVGWGAGAMEGEVKAAGEMEAAVLEEVVKEEVAKEVAE